LLLVSVVLYFLFSLPSSCFLSLFVIISFVFLTSTFFSFLFLSSLGFLLPGLHFPPLLYNSFRQIPKHEHTASCEHAQYCQRCTLQLQLRRLVAWA
jgi:hypothetical protein